MRGICQNGFRSAIIVSVNLLWISTVAIGRSDHLSAKEEAFCQNYAVHGMSQSDAYRNAYDVGEKTKDATVWSDSVKVASRPLVRARIEELNKIRRNAMGKSLDKLGEMLQELADANPNDLSYWRVSACRYCHGEDHKYHWHSSYEFDAAVKAYGRDLEAWALKGSKGTPPDAPDDSGGYGWRTTLKPDPDCPHCRGDGIGEMIIRDTRDVPRAARRLFKGVKVTKNGLEILTRDQDAAVDKLLRMGGGYRDRVEITGANGGPIQSIDATLDPQQAEQMYSDIMQGKGKK